MSGREGERRAVGETGSETAGLAGPGRMMAATARAHAPAGRAARRANALGAWSELEARLRHRRLAVFLDYDGTLAAIARRPELAVLTAEVRAAVQAVGGRWPTAVVSGRALEDVERLVALPGLYYAGSHGFDIRGPDGLRLEVAGASVATLGAAAAELRRRVAGVPGVLVEEKRFSVALHFRQAPRRALPRLEQAFRAVLRGHPGLRETRGKAILELRPAVEWGKGRAVIWLLDTLGLGDPDVVPIYLGDDVTDEDAFRVLDGWGVTVLVGDAPFSATAGYALADVAEVRHFLRRLATLPPPGAAPPLVHG